MLKLNFIEDIDELNKACHHKNKILVSLVLVYESAAYNGIRVQCYILIFYIISDLMELRSYSPVDDVLAWSVILLQNLSIIFKIEKLDVLLVNPFANVS